MKFLKRYFTTRKIVKEAKTIGAALSANPGKEKYFTRVYENCFTKSSDWDSNPKITAINNKIQNAVKSQFDAKTQSNWNVLVYPKFDFAKKYIGFEIRLKF